MSESINRCELTHAARKPIDLDKARAQHLAYEQTLERAARCEIVRVPAAPELPDAVFIEDTAVVADEVAIITRPGAESRRTETAAVAEALGKYRPLRYIEAPGTLDGGDVVVAGPRVFVGRTSRTNDHAIAQLRSILGPYGYDVRGVSVRGCLHLKSAATLLSERQLLVNPAWISREDFQGIELLAVDPGEPHAANILKAGDDYIYSSAFPRTARRLQSSLPLHIVDMSELAKAEGALTCCSLIIRA